MPDQVEDSRSVPTYSTMRMGRWLSMGFSRESKRLAEPAVSSSPMKIHPKLLPGLATQPCTSLISEEFEPQTVSSVDLMVAKALAVAMNTPPAAAQLSVLKKV